MSAQDAIGPNEYGGLAPPPLFLAAHEEKMIPHEPPPTEDDSAKSRAVANKLLEAANPERSHIPGDKIAADDQGDTANGAMDGKPGSHRRASAIDGHKHGVPRKRLYATDGFKNASGSSAKGEGSAGAPQTEVATQTEAVTQTKNEIETEPAIEAQAETGSGTNESLTEGEQVASDSMLAPLAAEKGEQELGSPPGYGDGLPQSFNDHMSAKSREFRGAFRADWERMANDAARLATLPDFSIYDSTQEALA